MTSLFENDSVLHPKAIECKVAPLVLFTIVDAYGRRPQGHERVIGTLLGANNEGVIEVRDAFAVPHAEQDEGHVAVDKAYMRARFELAAKTAPGNQLIGWFATGAQITPTSVAIHDFFMREIGRVPLHLLLDASLDTPQTAAAAAAAAVAAAAAAAVPRLGLRAYTGVPLALTATVGSLFQPVHCVVESFEAERVAIEWMAAGVFGDDAPGAVNAAPTSTALATTTTTTTTTSKRRGGGGKPAAAAAASDDLKTIEATLAALSDMLARVMAHVEAVERGAAPVTAAFRRAVADVLFATPVLDRVTVDRLMQGSLQDLLLVSYLTNLCRAQLALAERIQAVIT